MLRRLAVLLLLLAPLAFPPLVFPREHFQQPGPVRLDHDGEKWAEKTLRKLTLEEKIGQMFMLRAPAEFLNLASPEYTQLRDSIQKYHVGGLLLTVRAEGPFLYRNQPYEAAMFANQLQRESQLPLIVAADFERGLAMRFYSTTEFPHAMAFAATAKLEYAETLGRVTAQESRALGVEWGFFPVADVNSSPNNPIINTRAFSENPAEAGAFAAAYIKAARENGLLTTAKHFPGHGDTDTDSHLGLARVTGDRARLDAVELVPFRKAIDAGVDSVMVAHLTVPALEPDPERIATTSPAVVARLLRGELGFRGVVVTDAMDMNALTRLFPAEPGTNTLGRAAVEAVKAGNDMILLPADLDASFSALLAAVGSGEISEERIDASVRRILRMKASVGLNKARLVEMEALPRIIARPENLAAAREVAEAAVTLVRDNGQVLPLNGRASRPSLQDQSNGTAQAAGAYRSSGAERPSGEGQAPGEGQKRLVAVLFTDDVRTEYGRVFEQELRARVPDARIFFVDPRSAAAMGDSIANAVAQARAVVAAVYVTPSAGKKVQVQGVTTNSVSLDDATAALLNRILDQAEPLTVVVALGSPYVAASFPQARNYLCTFSGVPVSETAAVKALFGEIPIHGRLPVTIPGVAERGAGLDRPANPRPPQAGGTLKEPLMPDQDRFSSWARSTAAAAAAAVLLLALTACSMTVDKQGDDSKKKVDIQTPFGGLKVRTEVDPKEIGLPVYAGARRLADEGHDSSSANVTLGIPGFGMKVIAAKFESDDSSDKVLEFYRKELGTYGSVTECKGGIDLKGDPGSQEVTCKEGLGAEMRNKVELAVGKGSSHRIVSVEPRAKGCKFALVYLQFHGKESTM